MRLSLRLKWAGLVLLAAGVPLLLLALMAVRIQRSSLRDAEFALEAAVVAETGKQLETFFDQVTRATENVEEVLTEGRIEDDDMRLSLARAEIARSTAVDYVAMYAASGELVGSIQRGDGERRSEPPGATFPTSGTDAGPSWEAKRGSDGLVVARYLRPMRRNGQLRGYLSTHLALGVLESSLGDLSRDRFGAPARIAIVDDQLRLVASATGSIVEPASEIASLSSRLYLPPSAFDKDLDVTLEYIGPTGEPMVATVRTLPSRRWAVVVFRPQREAFQALESAKRSFALASAGLTLLAVLAALLVASRTTRPVAALVALTEAYGRREFAARSPVRSGDELERLGDSLMKMADGLAASDTEIARRVGVEAALARYLPAEVATAVATGTASLALGGERRDVSALFADVVGFTPFTERAEPEQVVEFLNELFTLLTEIVFRNGGMVDKFMGDCIMAVFGAQGKEGDHTRAALAAAEDMHRFVETSSADWKSRFGIEVKLGIGVASGLAIVGNLGSEARMEYTAIGDIVNVAARLEAIARPGQTLVTSAIAGTAGDAFSFRSLGEKPIRGKSQPIEIFSVTDA